MAIQFALKARRLPALAKGLAQLTPGASKAAGRGVFKAARIMLAVIKEFSPVDTGELRRSLGIEISDEAGLSRATIRATARHAFFVEFGITRPATITEAQEQKIAGILQKGFMRQGFSVTHKRAIDIIRSEMATLIDDGNVFF